MKFATIITATVVMSAALTGCDQSEELIVETVQLPNGKQAACVIIVQEECPGCVSEVKAMDCSFRLGPGLGK